MSDTPEAQHIRHDSSGIRPVQAPDAAQVHDRITEALRDPFAFAVALLGACGTGSVRANTTPTPTPTPAPRGPTPQAKRKPLRAADILAPRRPLPEFGPLSNRSKNR